MFQYWYQHWWGFTPAICQESDKNAKGFQHFLAKNNSFKPEELKEIKTVGFVLDLPANQLVKCSPTPLHLY